jgi:nucleoside-diphosphate-sugar epimerase
MSRGRRKTELAIPVVTADVVSGCALQNALEGIDVAYYLIHSMEASADGQFDRLERQGAENFARAARNAGVERVIYLGGLVPSGGPRSKHLASRLEVENTLLGATSSSVAFRASIVIGARSASFRFLVRLVERLPVLILPGWHTHRTSPVDERDMIEMLARAATSDAVAGQSLDVGGRDVVTYGELIDRIRDLMLVGRPTLSFSTLTVTPIASRISSVIAGEDHALIGPLMESLGDDLLPRDDRTASLLGVRLHSLDAAIERSLREWETFEKLAAR